MWRYPQCGVGSHPLHFLRLRCAPGARVGHAVVVLVRQIFGVLLQLLDGVVFVDVPVRLHLRPQMSQ